MSCSRISSDEVAHQEKVKFCFFCYKTVKTTVGASSSLVVDNFFKSLERFVGKKCSRSGRNFDCCEDCEFMISSFCEVFHQLKCLELQLEWKLELILKIIKLANRVPSRIQRVNETLEEGARRELEVVRSDIRKKCSHRISNSQPRVLLERPRLKKEESSSGDSKIHKGCSSAGNEDAVAISLGWITSFSAVVMMGVVGATNSSRNSEAEEFILDDDLEEEDSVVGGVGSQQNSDGESSVIDNLESTVTAFVEVSTKLEQCPGNEEDPELGSVMASSENGDEETAEVDVPKSREIPIPSPVPEESMEGQASPFSSSPAEEETKPEIKREAITSKKKLPWRSKRLQACPTCNKCFRYGKFLTFHIRRVHDNVEEIHRCGICKVSFNSYHRLRSHKLNSRNHQILRNRFLKKQQLIKIERDLQVPSDPEHPQESLQKKMVASKNPKPEVKATSSPYNLRLKRKRSFKEMVEGVENEEKEGPDCSEVSKVNLYCRRDGCRRRFRRREDFNRHKKLHVSGRYKCNFCKIVKSNVTKLSEHERMKHSSKNRIEPSSLNETFFCPRCPFETRLRAIYISHFAEAHIPGFEGTSKFKECDICRHKVSRTYLEQHIKAAHDTTGVDPTEVVKCKVPECQAFFVGKYRQQYLSLHNRRIHRSAAEEDQVLEEEEEEEETSEEEEGADGFKCKYCNRTFTKFNILKAHQKRFHSQRQRPPQDNHPNRKYKFICPVIQCTAKFVTEKGLQGHQKLHGSFNCNFCEVVKDYAPDLAIHENEQHHKKLNDRGVNKNFNCSRCLFSISKKSVYINHFLDLHLQLLSAVQRCPICQVESIQETVRYQKTHFQAYHNTEGLDPSDIHNCDQCPAYFIHARHLVFHKLDIHFGRRCPECGKSYKALDHLRIHIVRAHPNSTYFPNSVIFKCGVNDCDRVYMTAEQLETHKRTSHPICDGDGGRNDEDNYFQCPECPRKFKLKNKLAVHKFTKHSKLSFVCEECGKAWKTKQALETHMTYHKGPDEWKFQCATCGRKFADKQKLEQHQRTHTKEKPFICQYCGEKYAHRHNWRNHVKTKHPEEFELEVGGNGGGVNQK